MFRRLPLLVVVAGCSSDAVHSVCPPGEVVCDDGCCQLCNNDSDCTPTCSVEHPDGFVCKGGMCVRECGCVTNCTLEGAECGTITDSCGDERDCGSCDGDDICGGGGAPNTCGSQPCVPETCESLEVECGMPSNGCDDTLECDECGLRAHCSDAYLCVCDTGWDDCEPNGNCLCDLSNNTCYQGGCCRRDCTDKNCGDDGCGGVCGTCTGGHSECNTDTGRCECSGGYSDCDIPPDGECECDTGGTDAVCYDGACCTPDCSGKDCGDDGCGLANGCGDCPAGGVCNSSYVCECDADHMDCDGDGECECAVATSRCDDQDRCCGLQDHRDCFYTGVGCISGGDDGDGESVYWFDSCGNAYEWIADCEYRCQSGGSCWECHRCSNGNTTCGAWPGSCGNNPECAWRCQYTGTSCNGVSCTDYYLQDICDIADAWGSCVGGECSGGACIDCN